MNAERRRDLLVPMAPLLFLLGVVLIIALCNDGAVASSPSGESSVVVPIFAWHSALTAPHESLVGPSSPVATPAGGEQAPGGWWEEAKPAVTESVVFFFLYLAALIGYLLPAAFNKSGDRAERRRQLLILVVPPAAPLALLILAQSPLLGFIQGLLLCLGIVVIAAMVLPQPRPRSPRVYRPPLSRCFWVVDLICSTKTRERIFDQIVLDTRDDVSQALAAGRKYKAAIAHARGVYSIGSAVIALGLGKILKTAYAIFKAAK